MSELFLDPTATATGGAGRRALSLLLVDDDAEGIARLREAVGAAGDAPEATEVALEVAAGLDDALARLRAGRPDAVLLSLELADAPGLDALERLHRARPDVPVVVVSGLADESLAVEAVRRGAQDYLIRAEVDGRTVLRALRHGIERHRAEERVRQLLRSAIDGFWIVDLDGRILEVNDAYCRMSGYPREELLAMRIADIAVEATEGEIRANIAATVSAGGMRIETRHRAKDGRMLDLEASVTFHPASGTCFTFLRDVTERKRAERAVRESETLAAIGRLVSGVAHELNNPLAAILLFADTLLQEEERSAADLEALGAIRAQAQRSRAIVRDLLAIVRAREAHREPLDARALVGALERELRPRVEELGVRLTMRAGDAPAPLFADRVALGQALANLVLNGAQAAGTGGTVTVTAEREEDACRIAVEDDGPGIPPALLGRIFEPFFTTRPTGEGTGLGLPVSQGIVLQHGGTLTVEPTGGARGARFVVSLPLAKTPEPEASVPATPPAAPGPPRILVIDDEPSIRGALRRYLSRRGWMVDEASEGSAALEKLRAAAPGEEYAVVLSDLKMPGLSGVELHDRLAAEGSPYLSRLILSTGDLASPDAAAFVERTRCRVLQKPYELATLATALEAIAHREG